MKGAEMWEGVAALDFSRIAEPRVWEHQEAKIVRGLNSADLDRRLKVEKVRMPTYYCPPLPGGAPRAPPPFRRPTPPSPPAPGNTLPSLAQGLTDGLRPPLSPGTPGPLPRGGGRQGLRGYTYLQKVLGGGGFGLILKVRDSTRGRNFVRDLYGIYYISYSPEGHPRPLAEPSRALPSLALPSLAERNRAYLK